MNYHHTTLYRMYSPLADNNKIDAAGLTEILIPRSEQLCTTYDDILDALLLFDKQGTGMLNVSDCRHAVITLGEGIVPALVDEILRVANPDQEDYIKAEGKL